MKIGIDAVDTQPYLKSSNFSLVELACISIKNILKNTNISLNDIDGLIVTSSTNEQFLGNIISEMCGLNPKISTRVENLCNSGTTGILLGYSLIKSGICNAVLVTGAEKQPNPGNKLDWDIGRGQYDRPVHWAALYAENHFQKFGTTREDLARVSFKNHKNANINSKALFFKKKFTYENIFQSEVVVEPLKKLDCCYPCEGSSSILLVSEKISKRSEYPIWIEGIAQSTEGASFGNISSSLDFITTTRIAAKDAFNQASTSPKDIDVIEIHDAFSILEILSYEDLGFIEKGKGSSFIETSNVYTNTRGGLLGCGHPIGVTGIDQTNEIVLQLRGKAGLRQKNGCNKGMVHNMAAAGTSSTVIILER